ncbi:transcriptional regulator, AbrB family [Syntrophothermus lipocalidus DSM 12680]|uniref:Transcriptional regulator, AbrB family n=2 Tax=Syntrophothermus TaxID=129001 RepID=D7CMW3_SYNLT|nr:transcriptional regulator, AbrB family [Syntrophothermus lipocalidus DSM 12680]
MAQKKIFTPQMGPKGQMTLPKEIRTALEIEEGDRVLLRIEGDGKVVLEKAIIIPASKKDGFGEAAET